MERRLIVHGSFMGGYGLPGLLAFVCVIAMINAFLTRIWANHDALVVWVIIIGGAVVGIFILESISRRNFVEVTGDRIRWSFRQPPDKGEQALSSLRQVRVSSSGVCLLVEAGQICCNRAFFRRKDIERLIEGLRQAGAPVVDTRVAGPQQDEALTDEWAEWNRVKGTLDPKIVAEAEKHIRKPSKP